MAEYIERKELIAEIGVVISRIKRNPYDSKDETKGTLCGLAYAIGCIKSHPTADVVEIKYGKWRLETDEEMPDFMFKLVVCSVCGSKSNQMYRYCPCCGAKMIFEKEGADNEKL
jgi:hypothetical protein